MNTALLSAFSALAGSIVGGLTSGVTTWLSHRSQLRAGHRLHHVTQRETLYRDFVISASEAYGAAMGQSEPRLQDIVVLHAMVNRMRILSTSEVIACAEKTVSLILDKYDLPEKTFLEMRELMRSGEIVDPLREFGEISRNELSRVQIL
jgi:hypothetical protein